MRPAAPTEVAMMENQSLPKRRSCFRSLLTLATLLLGCVPLAQARKV